MNPKAPSNANAPDLDWSQVRETVRMLYLSVAQLDMALRDGDESVDALSNSFTDLIGNVQAISADASVLVDQGADTEALQRIQARCETVTGRVQEAIVAFQFYDKLAQRLHHVMRGLHDLAEVVDDPDRLYNPRAWHDLQQAIRERYSMREEQLMFEALISGASVEQALALFEAGRTQTSPDDAVELF